MRRNEPFSHLRGGKEVPTLAGSKQDGELGVAQALGRPARIFGPRSRAMEECSSSPSSTSQLENRPKMEKRPG
jgi:hypothetical protein